MSTLLAAAQPQIILRRNDRQLVAVEFQNNEPPPDFRSPWWPAGQNFVGDAGLDYGAIMEADWYETPEITSGVSSRLGILGVSRDRYGTPLAGCTVRVFRTSNGALVNETVSDANGAYTGNVYDGSAYFIVFYKAGVPDVFGTTVNTIIGS